MDAQKYFSNKSMELANAAIKKLDLTRKPSKRAVGVAVVLSVTDFRYGYFVQSEIDEAKDRLNAIIAKTPKA